MRAVAWGLTDVGLQREHNEDSFIVLKEYDLYVVADGMGGHRAGDVASKLATETISEFFRSTAQDDVTWPFHFDANLSEEENRLLTGIRVANRQIFERSTRSREYHGMGTTVVGAMFSPRKGRMYIGHVGDSRCYRIRGGQIQQLTRDHSLFNDYLLAMPDLTEEQRKELPKNVITRALGMQDQVAVDLQNDESQAGDVYVLCSDGLSGMVTDEEILAIVQSAQGGDMQEAPKQLIARANERGGEDNVTAVVIAIEDDALGATVEAKTGAKEEPPAMSSRSANAPTDVPPPGTAEPHVEVPKTPPPKVVLPNKGDNEFAEEPTLPAIDVRKSRQSDIGEEPTLPAIDLAKELAQIKKPG
ncbi:MAG TPA: Stp1/IreP family PP2C-type Ser/Thr phosphatase [Polyangiaceae bacterium]|jgi:protein phosphatase